MYPNAKCTAFQSAPNSCTQLLFQLANELSNDVAVGRSRIDFLAYWLTASLDTFMLSTIPACERNWISFCTH